ncbi:hypothetical protein M514_03927, partial [Trichuris suis]
LLIRQRSSVFSSIYGFAIDNLAYSKVIPISFALHSLMKLCFQGPQKESNILGPHCPKYPKQTTSSGTGSQHGTKTTDSSRSVYEKLTTLQKTMVKDACKERCEGYLLCSIVDNGRSYKECVEKCIREESEKIAAHGTDV